MNNYCTKDTKEQRQIVRTIIVDIVKKMLSGEMEVKWVGNKIDLFEMIHIAYISMEVRHEDGRLMYQSEMVRTLFARHQMSVPTNNRIYLNRINQRKGINASPLIDRMQYLLFVSKADSDPHTLLRKLSLIE